MSTAEPSALATWLEWDSEFFGRRMARATVQRLNAGTAAGLLEWCRANEIDCLYFLAEADDAETVRLAEQHGFRLVDVRVTLQTRLTQAAAPVEADRDAGQIGPAQDGDAASLAAIAAEAHRDSRFYYDGGFSSERCDQLYRTWIERSCAGYAQAVLVARRGGQPAGYITCQRRAGEQGQIGLVGVSPSARGQGVGRTLVRASLAWFWEHGCRQVDVVTQGRNVAAQRLYQQQHFQTAAVHLWYHLWPKS